MVRNELISILHTYTLLIVYIHKYIFDFIHTWMDGDNLRAKVPPPGLEPGSLG